MNRRPLIRALSMLGVVAGLGSSSAALADVTIYDMQNGTIPYSGVTLHNVDGVVCMLPVHNGFWAMEPGGGAYSGIWVFTSVAPGIARNRLVNIVGKHIDFFGMNELDARTSGGGSWTDMGPAGVVPSPQVVTIGDINDPDEASTDEQWEGVLMEVDNTYSLTVGGGDTFGDSYIYNNNFPADSIMQDNQNAGAPFAPQGSALTHLRGMGRYDFSLRRLVPRDAADIGYQFAPTVSGAYSIGAAAVNVQFTIPVEEASAENVNNYFLASLAGVDSVVRNPSDLTQVTVYLDTPYTPPFDETITVGGVKSAASGVIMAANENESFLGGFTPASEVQMQVSAANDSSIHSGKLVTMTGYVTFQSEALGGRLYLQDPGGGVRSGMFADLLGNSAVVGDSVVVMGRIDEDFGQTQLDFAGFTYFRNYGQARRANPMVADPVTCSDVVYNDVLNTEQWENCLVLLENVRLDSLPGGSSAFSEYGAYCSPARIDTAKVDQDVDFGPYEFNVGDSVSVTGVLQYSFNAYNVTPRAYADVEIFESVQTAAPDAARLANPGVVLHQNRPNPFNPQTEIRFEVYGSGLTTLTVHNVQGQLVRSLIVGEQMPQGMHIAHWDGRDDSGRGVTSGAYFLRIETPEGVGIRKMTLLR